ncbi:hypothetical protein [Pedobacter punctiformis]|uniref:Uncharacterized protein n=1 Tax=Pedobacter punctiformis TaxID=3004097 RepID=A0ABT4LBQ5_9SPHI|nr:hypothetical protein [Pedobacter sp. HCMS5-2]MCZ4245337.1 hypothetical protein [Pedobacter sp. HCMS5-2]
MSAHDTHAPVQDTKGIWALPMTAWVLVLVLVFAFTRPKTEEKHEQGHEKTEAHH